MTPLVCALFRETLGKILLKHGMLRDGPSPRHYLSGQAAIERIGILRPVRAPAACSGHPLSATGPHLMPSSSEPISYHDTGFPRRISRAMFLPLPCMARAQCILTWLRSQVPTPQNHHGIKVGEKWVSTHFSPIFVPKNPLSAHSHKRILNPLYVEIIRNAQMSIKSFLSIKSRFPPPRTSVILRIFYWFVQFFLILGPFGGGGNQILRTRILWTPRLFWTKLRQTEFM